MSLENRPVKWGVIGCGNIARHAVCPAMTWAFNAQLEAIASRDELRARELARELGARRHHGTYEALINDPEIDAIYIGLPNGLHEEWSIRSLNAGKHVLCEKSMALDPESAARMAAASTRNNRLLMEAYMYRHHPQWDTVRGMIAEGAIGELRVIRAGLQGNLTDDPANHRWEPGLGDGALFDVTCYAVNVARYLTGGEPQEARGFADLHAPGVDRSSTATLLFDGGIMAVVDGSLVVEGGQHCEIIGTRGILIVEKPFIPGWGGVRLFHKRAGETTEIKLGGANHYLHMVEHFSRCVAEPGRSLDPGENGLAQAKALAAIRSWW